MHVHWTKIAVAALLSATIATQQARAEDIECSKSEDNATTIVSAPTVSTQNTTWKDVMAGRVVPLTMKGGDLGASWRSFLVGRGTDVPSLMLGEYGLTDLLVFYSNGEVVSIIGQDYLVAYNRHISIGTSDLDEPGALKKTVLETRLKRDSPLYLSLLNVRLTDAFTQMRAFDPTVFDIGSPDNEALSQSNLKELANAIIQYSMGYDGVYPPMQNMYSLKRTLQPIYIKLDEVFLQPGSKTFYVPNASLSRKQALKIMNVTNFASIYEAQADNDGKRGVGFTNGSVKRVTQSEWLKIKKESGIK